MAFSATSAATEGFRIVRREPWTIVAWAGVVLVFGLASLAMMVPALGSLMAGAKATTPPTLAQSMATMGESLRLEAIVFPLLLAAAAVFSCAVYRAVLRPEDKRFCRLRLGSDELRMALLFVLLGVACLLGSIVLIVVAGVAVAALGLLVGGAPAMAAIMFMAVYLALLWASVWLGVRLSLAGPMTFAQRRLRVRTAWKLTRGRFWPLLGCNLLTLAFVLILSLVSVSIYALAGLATGGSISAVTTSMLKPDLGSMQSYLTPARVINQLVGALVGAVIYAVYFAPAAAAYGAIAETSPDNQAAAFD